jgi:hypothetical protein
MASNTPSIRELALAALARRHGDRETLRETVVRRCVSQLYPASHPRETPLAESNQPLNPSVSPSHSQGVRQMRHPENNETPRETVVRRWGVFPYAEALNELERGCPDYVEAERWQQCVTDAQRFLAAWGDKAVALGWTAAELFGLHQPPAKPHPSYSRLSRYNCIGLLWLLQGREVIALTDTTATIRTRSGGSVTYRKHRKPALGPLGDSLDDSLDDFGVCL